MFNVIYGWELTKPKMYGIVKPININKKVATILENSICMPCANCGCKNDLYVYETHKKWHLWYLVSLGTSEYRYHLYCKNCNGFQLTLKKVDIDKLAKKYVF